MTLPTYTPSQITTIKRTVAADTDATEFDLFMEACKSYRLDPFRKQISALVFNKDNANKRQMAIIVSRDGYRVLAQRCGDYRPASEPPHYTYDPELKGPTNPAGIVSARVTLFKQDKQGNWHPVSGEAYWEEFAPIKAEWAWSEQDRKRKPTGNQTVDGNWAKMPRVMISKCAESQALRAGWPDHFGGVYSEEEMDRAVVIDATASEIVQSQEQAERQAALGGAKICVMFDGAKLESIAPGEFFDRVAEYVRSHTPEEVYRWRATNTEPLRQFWGASPGDALELKRIIEAKTAEFATAA